MLKRVRLTVHDDSSYFLQEDPLQDLASLALPNEAFNLEKQSLSGHDADGTSTSIKTNDADLATVTGVAKNLSPAAPQTDDCGSTMSRASSIMP